MARSLALSLLGFTLGFLGNFEAQGQEAMPDRLIGFAPASKAAEARAEAAALATPSPENARKWLRTLTEEPHVAGTPADRETAEFVRDKLKSWGWDVEMVEYEVLLNYPFPRSVKLEITRPVSVSLPVVEEPNPRDKDSASPDAWPAFHGYGVSGHPEGQVVYANYGRVEDFKTLDKLGVDVRDKIVLVRYGHIFRGLKVWNAQRRGARGVLIYSDPADDGYGKGDTYPFGPFRPESAIQRGSVQFLSLGPGDPSTPGTPSVKGAKRLPFDELNGFVTAHESAYIAYPLALNLEDQTFKGRVIGQPLQPQYRQKVQEWEKSTGLKREDYAATIPSLPVSYGSARPILEKLAGPEVPSGWQGGLPFAYHVGPGPVEVSFSIAYDYQIRPIWNVIATLKGSVEPDRWVMLGNHRDAWVYGAVDPSSGTAATLETCRALGEAKKAGWTPRRTIMYANWDAEEYGLVGSTEWAEDHESEISEKAVMMLNVDAAVSGPNLSAAGIASLRDLFLSAASDVDDPRTGKTLAEEWLGKQRKAWADQPIDLDPSVWSGSKPGQRHEEFEPQMGFLGSGSDYTAFVDHLGVPALNLAFGGRYGVYHSMYDNIFWMENFCDPEYLYHAASAKLYALLMLRASSSEVVPLTFSPYALALREHVDALRRSVLRKGRATGKPFEFDGLDSLVSAVRRFEEQAKSLDRATEDLAHRGDVDADTLRTANDALTQVERRFLLSDGLPGRTWFKHAIYAPGVTTGYASWPLPAVRQAVEENDHKALAKAVEALVPRIDSATEAMNQAQQAATGGE